MNTRTYRKLLVPAVAGVMTLSLSAGAALADESKSASEQWTESIEQIQAYGADQKNEAVDASRSAAEAIDARLQQMENWVARNWDKLSEEAREDKRETISDLRRQRNDLAEWFGAMKHSSAESWEEVKGGFVNAYNTLGEKFDNVMNEFKSDDSTQ